MLRERQPTAGMKVFERLRAMFRRFEPITVHDGQIGNFTSDPYGNWHGRLSFGSSTTVLDILLRTGTAPPNFAQVQFVCEVRSRFDTIWRELRGQVFAGLDSFADGTTMEQLFDSLQVNGISFWQLDTHPFRWEISAETPLDDHLFGIMMDEFEYTDFRMDG